MCMYIEQRKTGADSDSDHVPVWHYYLMTMFWILEKVSPIKFHQSSIEN